MYDTFIFVAREQMLAEKIVPWQIKCCKVS
jgi:hypothetical protein